MKMKIIEFYFDLGSPYSYLAFHQIQKIATEKKAEIIWKPILLGGIFKATGNSSPMSIAAKARYSKKDMQRWSKYWNIPIQVNPYFPINTLMLMRLLTAVQLYQPEHFVQIATGLFNAMFGEPRNLNDQHVFIQVITELGLSTETVQAWLNDEKVKGQLKFLTEQAVERGVFGAPTFFVRDELYWGVDHLHFVEMALESN